MKQKSEQISLEYKVEFEDGLRPRVQVYGIDPKTGEIYGTEARIGISVGAGYHLSPPSQEDFEKKTFAMVGFGPKLDTSLVVGEFVVNPQECENPEQRLYAIAKETGTNVIKVQDHNHMRPAIYRRIQLYQKQFHGLADRFTNLFKEFIKEHPAYGQY